MLGFRFFSVPLLYLLALPLLAQVDGSITGEVKDSSGAIVNNAQMSITEIDTGVSQTAKPNDQGVYSFLSLPVGKYRLEVKAPGFATYSQTGIVLNASDELRIDVSLQVGQVNETVEVSTSAVHVETENTQLGDVITGSQITAMFLNGRQFTDLLGLQAGVVPIQSAQSTGYGNYFGSTEQGNVSIMDSEKLQTAS